MLLDEAQPPSYYVRANEHPTLGDEKNRHKSQFHAVQPVHSLGFVVNPPSLRLAAHKAKAVADWHTAMFLQVALARFINDGEFARHIRKMRGVYRARHDMVTEILKRKFANHLEVVPWIAGLHVAAPGPHRVCRGDRCDRPEGIRGRRGSSAAIDVHPYCVGAARNRTGYGAIPTANIKEGPRRLRHCFDP